VMERAIVPRRRVMFILWRKYSGRVVSGQWSVVRLLLEAIWTDGI
jgi:hypothetical protein